MTIVWLARVTLILWILFAVAFELEGLKAQGPRALKVLGHAAEAGIWVLLVWVGFFL